MASDKVKKRNDEVSIKDIVALFVPKLWIIAICAVVLGILLGGYAMFFKADTYTSKATFILSTSTTVSESDIKLSAQIIDILPISSRDFLEDIAASVNESYSSDKWEVTHRELGRSISKTKLNDGAPVFTLAVTTNDAQKSKAIADTLVYYMTGDDDSMAAPIQNYLPENYEKITVNNIESPTIGSVNDKGVITNAIVGFLVGAVVSMVVIYMIAMFDVVIHDRKKLEDHFDIPILGVIPKYESFADESTKGGIQG